MRFFREHKLAVFIIVALLAGVIALGAFGASRQSVSVAERIGGDVTAVPQSGVSSVGGFFSSIGEYFGSIKKLRSENEALKNENTNLQKQLNDTKGLEAENAELRQMLKLKKYQTQIDMMTAEVSAKDPSNWYATITINKGKSDGVKERQPVVNSNRELVGQISAVGDNWAEVITVIDPQSSIGAEVKRSGAIGILEGDSQLRYQGKSRFGYISREADIKQGDYIETSGLGGVYPRGLIIGVVEEVYDNNATMSRGATVKPCADVASIRQVFVVTGFKQADISDTETTTRPIEDATEDEEEDTDADEEE